MVDEARTALVTGGTGFVGIHVVDVLLEAGYRVRCTVRKSSRLRWLEGKPVELVELDLVEGDASDAVADVSAVFHFAGLTRGSGRELNAANYEATRALVAACASAARERRVVFCSSQAAAGPSLQGERRREEDPPLPTTDYGRSKLAAERAVLEAEGVEPVVLRPAAVYGPRDEDTLPYFKMAAHGVIVIPGIRERVVQIVHARDVAQAALAAVESPGAAGGTFFVAHPDALTWRELAQAIARAVGRRVLPVRVPSPVLRAVGGLASALGAARRPGQLDLRRARDLSELDWTCSVERAQEVLGWSPEYGAEPGLRDTADWYRSQGWL